MKISHHESDDILYIELQTGAIVRDVSPNLNVNVDYVNKGVGEIAILDAQQARLFPWVLDGDMDKLLEKETA